MPAIFAVSFLVYDVSKAGDLVLILTAVQSFAYYLTTSFFAIQYGKMKFTTTVLSAALASLAFAAPSKTIRQAQNCEQYGSVQTGSYTVYNNLWNESAATSGSQCFSVTGLTDNVLSWVTTYVQQLSRPDV